MSRESECIDDAMHIGPRERIACPKLKTILNMLCQMSLHLWNAQKINSANFHMYQSYIILDGHQQLHYPNIPIAHLTLIMEN